MATSALALNFVPDRVLALKEMQRVLRPAGLLSFYVWDYPGGGVGFIDAFWSAASELDPAAADLDESIRFPFCTRKGLSELCETAGIADVHVAPIEIETSFATFADFMHPFTLGAGPAPGYYTNLDGTRQDRLRGILRRNLGEVEPVVLTARAWALKTTWFRHVTRSTEATCKSGA